MNAVRKVNVEHAENQLHEAKRMAAWTTASSLLFVLVWTLLTLVRFRALKQRRWRLVVDVICIALAASAMTASAFGAFAVNKDRRFPFTIPVRNALPGDWIDHYDSLREWGGLDGPCFKRFRLDSGIRSKADFDYVLERINLLIDAHTNSALFYLAVSLCCLALMLLVVSIISTVLSLCVKSQPGTNNRIWSPGATAAAAAGAMPPSQAVEYFMRFIELVPPPSDGVVLGAGREGNDCRICLEVLLEDIARLHGCQHMFHRRCILRWLVNSNDPSCPLCKEPMRVSEHVVEHHDEEDPDHAPSVHIHNGTAPGARPPDV